LHAHIAGALEAHFPEIVASQPELLAHHSAEAGNPERAIHYFVAAAERALAQSATIEAGAHAEAAFALLARLPEDDERRRRELVVQMVRSRVAIATKGHTAPEYAQILLRAKELCEALSDGTTLCLVTYGLWNIAWGAADYRSAREHAATLLRYGERKHIPSCVAFGHFVLGTCLLPTGALRDAGKHVEAALRHRPIELPGGQIITWGGAIVQVSALGTLSDCQFLTGVPREAEATAREMAIEAREVPQLYARAIALNVICRTLALRRNAPELLQPAHEMVELTREQGYPQFAARAMVFRGWALAMTGEAAEGLRLARCGVEAARSIGFVCWLTVHLALLAECQASAGDAPAATATLDEALAFAAATEERVWEAELYRLKAEFRLAAGSAPRQAEELLQKAIATARARGAWLLELRAATGLARLRAARGRRAQARDPLTRALKGCSNTTEAAEISEAKAVLASLG
jgi:predicted ATPase